jgi:hypothetical protein
LPKSLRVPIDPGRSAIDISVAVSDTVIRHQLTLR